MKKNGICLIISGGRFANLSPEVLKADYVIACDKGLDHADKYGIRPDIVIGDYDSVSPENLVRIESGELKSMRYPKEKDDTDTMIAMRHAISLGYPDIRIVCCFGKRMDHAIANIQTAHFGAERGAIVRMYDEETEVIVFSDVFPGGTVKVSGKAGGAFSVFSLSDVSRGVTIKGTKYELVEGELTNAFPLGQSNEFAGDCAEVSVAEGTLMIAKCDTLAQS